ncbi:MAG: helix-turn-helix transcriptional regulator [Verrucomicrobia bacterium]|nr:helix-turn-helix transcriptional regulator [Verrucomicrobiota bacterium]
MSRRPDSRDALLAAAEAVVLKAGAAHLTLDAVAEKAGVSKGGLLYHFPNKAALLEAMVARQIARCETAENAVRDTLPETPGKPLQAYVLAALREQADTRRICSALLAAAANNPKLLAPARENFRRRLNALAKSTGGNFARAAAVCLATDGLWLLELLNLSPLTTGEREKVLAELLRLAELAAVPAPLARRPQKIIPPARNGATHTRRSGSKKPALVSSPL